MENFELLEKYAAGQLNGAEKDAFEKQLQANPSLHSDVALQKQIIEGIKKARISDLKAMLNQVPVSGAMQGGTSAVQIVSGVITVATIITGTLLYTKPWEKEKPASLIEKKLPEAKPNIPAESTPGDPKEEKATSVVSDNNKETKKNEPLIKSKSVRPKIEVVDPTDELTQEPSSEKGKTDKPQSAVVSSRIAVETNTTSEKYSFHYQFSQGKLLLYGNFDKGLYEVLEVNGDNHSVFLYYKNDYYLLNERQTAITPLSPIKDLELVQKLKAYRGN
jgi:hypothetical protein